MLIAEKERLFFVEMVETLVPFGACVIFFVVRAACLADAFSLSVSCVLFGGWVRWMADCLACRLLCRCVFAFRFLRLVRWLGAMDGGLPCVPLALPMRFRFPFPAYCSVIGCNGWQIAMRAACFADAFSLSRFLRVVR